MGQSLAELPDLFFRVRENGAAVFRIDAGNHQRRIEMVQIAIINIRNGEIKGQGERSPTDAEQEAIQTWLTERRSLLARREMDDILKTIDQLNLTAQWAQSKATTEQLDEVTDALLMAMHDLRAVLVRKKADRPEPGV
jgi:hypothetical protein